MLIMPPMELGTGIGLAKYAPVLFLTVKNSGEVNLNIGQILHTLIVAGIVAAVTMYGTVRVIEVRLDALQASITRINVAADEAIRVQREIVPMRNLQVKTLQDDVKDIQARVGTLEKRR